MKTSLLNILNEYLLLFPDEKQRQQQLIEFLSNHTTKDFTDWNNFDGHIVKYLPNDFHKIRHGFVISIHKSQGSEFDLVMLPICSPYKRMLYRKLIYTAITRAKKKLIIIGEEDAFVYSVNNNNENTRKTKLKEKLQKIRIK